MIIEHCTADFLNVFSWYFVIYLFVPLIIYLLPIFFAVVFIDIASDPASGSVKAKDPINSPVANCGKYFSFCSSHGPLLIYVHFPFVHF